METTRAGRRAHCPDPSPEAGASGCSWCGQLLSFWRAARLAVCAGALVARSEARAVRRWSGGCVRRRRTLATRTRPGRGLAGGSTRPRGRAHGPPRRAGVSRWRASGLGSRVCRAPLPAPAPDGGPTPATPDSGPPLDLVALPSPECGPTHRSWSPCTGPDRDARPVPGNHVMTRASHSATGPGGASASTRLRRCARGGTGAARRSTSPSGPGPPQLSSAQLVSQLGRA